MEPAPPSWTDLILGPLGLLVGALLAVYAFASGRVIPRSQYEAMVVDRNRWRDEALAMVKLGETAVAVAKEKA